MGNVTPGELVRAWKLANWPPRMRRIGELPIYLGDHRQVSVLAESLAEMLTAVSEHIMDDCRGRTPRWMAIPKIVFGVQRLNLVDAKAKASKSFESVEALVTKCGMLLADDRKKLDQWMQRNAEGQLVAHKEFVDMRAYAYVLGERRPRRFRFYSAGLVVAAPTGQEVAFEDRRGTEREARSGARTSTVVQDHRKRVRMQRSDAYSEPLATTSRGWVVYGRSRARGL